MNAQSASRTMLSPARAARRLVEGGVILVLSTLFVRTFIAEAYIVPTGSMAPALAGYHKRTTCPECGWPVMVGRLGASAREGDAFDDREADRHYRRACCPNCGWDDLKLSATLECPGDRLLVHKHVFDLRRPRRWEMVVFQNPGISGAAGEAFIKRLIGLPGESVQVHDGDVYINGDIARKTLAEVRAMRLPVYDTRYPPRDPAGRNRWRAEPGGRWQDLDGGRRFYLPEGSEDDGRMWLSYRHLARQIDDRGGTVWREDEIRDLVGYNGGQATERSVHDLMLEAEITATGRGWLVLAITDGYDDVLIELPVGRADARARVRHAVAGKTTGQALERASVPFALEAGRALSLEVGLVDRRLFLAVDGKEPMGVIDLPVPPGDRARLPLSRFLALGGHGPLALGGQEAGLMVAGLRVHRDLHYTDRDERDRFPHASREPFRLGRGEYFVLGDNSANSYDSRCWKESPVVRQEWLVGKPFLVHLPSRMLDWDRFGQSSAMAVPDWSRMKLLR